MVKERSAGAVVYRMSEDGNIMYLLLQATSGKPWGFAKGKIDAGETEETAARREIAEESGIEHVTLDPDFRIVVHYNYRRGRVVVKKDVTYFLARADRLEVHLSAEHIASMWVSLPEALELVQYENARVLLRKAHRHLEMRLGTTLE